MERVRARRTLSSSSSITDSIISKPVLAILQQGDPTPPEVIREQPSPSKREKLRSTTEEDSGDKRYSPPLCKQPRSELGPPGVVETGAGQGESKSPTGAAPVRSPSCSASSFAAGLYRLERLLRQGPCSSTSTSVSEKQEGGKESSGKENLGVGEESFSSKGGQEYSGGSNREVVHSARGNNDRKPTQLTTTEIAHVDTCDVGTITGKFRVKCV